MLHGGVRGLSVEVALKVLRSDVDPAGQAAARMRDEDVSCPRRATRTLLPFTIWFVFAGALRW